MHLRHPVAEAVDDHPAHDRLVRVERVAGAREVGVAGAVGAVEEVVLLVGEAAIGERRPAVAALGRVVVDHVEDDLEPRPVERLDEVAELVDRALRAGPAAVGAVGREERDRLVAPVVGPVARRVVGVEREHRQQLDGGDAEVDEVRDLLDEARVGPAPSRVHPAARVSGEALDVRLVDHGLRERAIERPVALPVVRGEVDDHALHGAPVIDARTCSPALPGVRR